MLSEFKKFAAKGNVLDMAVGIVIGAAFATIIGSLVGDLIMPVVGLFAGGIDFSDMHVVLREGATAGPYMSVAAAKEAGAVTLNWGLFVNAVVNFLIVAFALFMVIRGFNRMKQEEEAAPAAPPEPSKEEVLLTEIRDALTSRN
jgi:large conductance mechanosensitive channel